MDVVLVLDDYHRITAEPIHAALGLLLDRRPPTLHVVIATREEPPLSLARRRLHGELAELDGADLQLCADEAAQLMAAMNLDPSPALLDAVLNRTEGCVAGVKLIALLLQRQAMTPEQLASLRGDQRYLYSYLVEEVLEQQPPAVEGFLLVTALDAAGQGNARVAELDLRRWHHACPSGSAHHNLCAHRWHRTEATIIVRDRRLW